MFSFTCVETVENSHGVKVAVAIYDNLILDEIGVLDVDVLMVGILHGPHDVPADLKLVEGPDVLSINGYIEDNHLNLLSFELLFFECYLYFVWHFKHFFVFLSSNVSFSINPMVTSKPKRNLKMGLN